MTPDQLREYLQNNHQFYQWIKLIVGSGGGSPPSGDYLTKAEFKALANVPNGYVQLDSTGSIPVNLDKGDWIGNYNTVTDAPPQAPYGRYIMVNGETYYYNVAFVPPKWSAEDITASEYTALTDAQKSGQPTWNIIPG